MNNRALMYKTMHTLAPIYLYELFQYTNEVYDHLLTSPHNNLLYVPKPNIEVFRNSFSYSGSKIWNAIPETIKHSSAIQQFKHRHLEWKLR